MLFSEYTYSLLIVSSNTKFNSGLSDLLEVNRFWPVIYVKSIGDARRLFFDKSFDLVLINAPLPDDFGENLASDICNKSEAGVVLLTSSDLYNDVYFKISESGVIVVEKPITKDHLKKTLNLACATKERMNRLIKKQVTVEEKIEEMRLVNKAKWKLIEHAHMTEAEAHRFIEKKSMDERMSKSEIAKKILRQLES